MPGVEAEMLEVFTSLEVSQVYTNLSQLLMNIYFHLGEFSSPKQGTFYHYNDFWRLEPSTREWTRLESKGKSPPARSGHRLVYYKVHCCTQYGRHNLADCVQNYIVLFGGFQDTSQQTRYLQDLWLYDCHSFTWHNPVLPPATQKPDARSSFSFHPHGLGAILYGGYSRVKANTMDGKQTKGGGQASKSVLKPTIHQDSWFLRISPPPPEAPPNTAPVVRWERRKKPANAPNPPRAGATQAYHKGRGVMFGGVHDVEESEEGIESEFFDQLFALNLERNRFFPLTLRRARPAPKKQADDRGAKRGRGKADEAELLRNLAALEMKGTIVDPDAVNTDSIDEADEVPAKALRPVLSSMPHPRFNAQLAVLGDVLYIFGGTYERGDREFTFDEMHAIDLVKLDGVQEIYRRELENWHVDYVESESESDEDDESEDEDMEGATSGVALPVLEPPDEPATLAQKPLEVEEEQAESVIIDNRPHPRPFESLREFYARTSNTWQQVVIESLQKEDGAFDQSIKELRRVAFESAETKWWDCREEITAEEERQEEAGIGEIVSIGDRANEVGSSGRRR